MLWKWMFCMVLLRNRGCKRGAAPEICFPKSSKKKYWKFLKQIPCSVGLAQKKLANFPNQIIVIKNLYHSLPPTESCRPFSVRAPVWLCMATRSWAMSPHPRIRCCRSSPLSILSGLLNFQFHLENFYSIQDFSSILYFFSKTNSMLEHFYIWSPYFLSNAVRNIITTLKKLEHI